MWTNPGRLGGPQKGPRGAAGLPAWAEPACRDMRFQAEKRRSTNSEAGFGRAVRLNSGGFFDRAVAAETQPRGAMGGPQASPERLAGDTDDSGPGFAADLRHRGFR